MRLTTGGFPLFWLQCDSTPGCDDMTIGVMYTDVEINGPKVTQEKVMPSRKHIKPKNAYPNLSYQLMIPPGQTHSLSNPLELDRIIKYSPFTQFSNLSPENLLPRRLRWWVLERTHFLLSLFNLFCSQFDIGHPLFQVDSNDIAVLEVSQHSTCCCFWGCV
jgi:hypothetical protein